ncbi:MAG: PAS domain S-box protein [Desulfohalobiaceae bacterium]
MCPQEQLQELQEEIEYLRAERQKALNALDLASNLGNFDTRLSRLEDTRAILEETVDKLQQLLQFQSISFYLVQEDDASFFQAYCTPYEYSQLLEQEFQELVQDHTFAYALAKNRPVTVQSQNSSSHLLLHTLATPRRTRGMLLARLKGGKQDVSEYSLYLLTLVMLSCANFLESYELYKHFHNLNKQLEDTVNALRKSNTYLEEKNQQLKLEEQKLKQSEERYRAIFENTGTPTFIVAEDTTIEMANREVENFLGYSRQELEGQRSWAEFICAEDKEKMRQYYQQRRTDPENVPQKYIARGIDRFGEEKHCIFNVDLIPGTKKSVVSVLDITEKNKLEKQLRQAQKLEAVGTMAGGIAHEFNNLLQGMSANIQALSYKYQQADPQQKHLNELDRLISRATAIVNRLLTFSRHADFDFQTLDLNRAIQDNIQFLHSTIAKNISLEIELDPDIPLIYADPTQMEQILINLAKNSADAMDPSEGGTIQVETSIAPLEKLPASLHSQSQKPGEYLLWSIQDNGQGMDSKTQEKIFEPFFTTKGPGQGTGLGLALIYGIVDAHEGQIRCESELNKGTRFEIFLPITAESKSEASKQEPTSALASPSQLGGVETILLIDDEQGILEVTQELLENSGYSVKTALNGEEGLEIFYQNQEDIDLVLLDLGLPEISGEKCLQRILELDPQAKVIVASGYKTHPLAKSPQAYGALDALGKPYSFQELLSKIRQHQD